MCLGGLTMKATPVMSRPATLTARPGVSVLGGPNDRFRAFRDHCERCSSSPPADQWINVRELARAVGVRKQVPLDHRGTPRNSEDACIIRYYIYIYSRSFWNLFICFVMYYIHILLKTHQIRDYLHGFLANSRLPSRTDTHTHTYIYTHTCLQFVVR